ncbi:hypothetical protein [Sphingosinicella humi]|uniref:Uncharacterized protein n=1 Tax=Allosphingosinicella humi TaxID=2068657 RepID=A0A2U2J5D4_9SPHN|nr:hypothetical protein [Sphingosinicella humi]PWG03512.1 hypothetical protein DF286_11995 [Sphingosinicella humi]
MINTSSISHALILDDGEINQLQVDDSIRLRRRTATRLRMRIALFSQSTCAIIGAATLSDASAEDDDGGSDWQFDQVEWFASPVAVSSGKSGPVWIRLSQQQRDALRSKEPSAQFEPSPADVSLPRPTDEDQSPAARNVVTAAEAASGIAEVIISELPHGEAPASVEPTEPLEESKNTEESSLDPINAARERATAFVPTSQVTADEARQILIRLRDEEMKPSFPLVSPTMGILRRAMMQSLLEEGVSSREEYARLVPADLRAATDKTHVAAYLDVILAILARLEEPPFSSASVRRGSHGERVGEAGTGWTDAELWAAVESYAEMLTCEARGIPYNKAARIRQLREGVLRNRTAASVTLRWQNISHLLYKAGRPFISGLKPASNVGENIERRLSPMLRQRQILPPDNA